MLTELCEELNNWFECARFYGQFEISDGKITSFNDGEILRDGQYFRIVGSLFNDGVHQYGEDLSLVGEVFSGAVWLMAVPPAVISLAEDIEAWRSKYEAPDSANMSPYNSESFGGYSYNKSGGGSSADGSLSGTWQGAFANRLKRYKRIGTKPRVLRPDAEQQINYRPRGADEIRAIVRQEIRDRALEG